MAKDLYEVDTQATEILNQAQNAVDFDLLETMFTDEEGKLGETENTQPALLTHSIALLNALNNVEADYTMGHSLGEYSSLVAAEVLSFEDAVKIVRKRGELMAQAFPSGVGSMAAVLGLDYDEVAEICENFLKKALSLNLQILILQDKLLFQDIRQRLIVLSNKEIIRCKRVLPLNVSGPFHSSMMQVIEKILKIILINLNGMTQKFQ